jgi:hypothetical protein
MTILRLTRVIGRPLDTLFATIVDGGNFPT